MNSLLTDNNIHTYEENQALLFSHEYLDGITKWSSAAALTGLRV